MLQLADNAAIATDSGTIILSGAGSTIRALDTTTRAQVALDSTLFVVGSGGSLQLLGGRGFTAVANHGSFYDAGVLQLGGGTLTATRLTIATIARLVGFGTVDGALTLNGAIESSGGTLALGGVLSGSGALATAAGSVLALATGGTARRLANAGSLLLRAGTLSIGGALSGTGTLLVATGATLALSGGGTLGTAAYGGTLALSGAATFSSSGTARVSTAVVNQANVAVGSGVLAFLGAVTNDGRIGAGSGTLAFSQNVAGSGTVTVAAGGTAILYAGDTSAQTIDFLAAPGTLALGKPDSFGGTTDGFAHGDTIDLLATVATSTTFAGGVLTLGDGTTVVARLHFAGSYTGTSFMLGSNGHGGTLITYG